MFFLYMHVLKKLDMAESAALPVCLCAKMWLCNKLPCFIKQLNLGIFIVLEYSNLSLEFLSPSFSKHEPRVIVI